MISDINHIMSLLLQLDTITRESWYRILNQSVFLVQSKDYLHDKDFMKQFQESCEYALLNNINYEQTISVVQKFFPSTYSKEWDGNR